MTREQFKDHFSGHAEEYARHRPTYPPALFTYLAGAAGGKRLAWDCATGNGQAALALTPFFDRVVATDASPRQIAAAATRPGVEYRVEPAERSSLAPASCDLVTVAQALHWLDRPRFYVEVRRVARPGAVVAAWAYDFLQVTAEIDGLVHQLANAIVGSWWPPERRHIDEHYATIEFPFSELETPAFDMLVEWSAEACLSYLRTWSAVRRFQSAEGRDPVAVIEEPLRHAWGSGERQVRFPLLVRAGLA